MSHSFLEEVPASRLTSTTIRRMYELIDQAKTDRKFQELVYGLTKGLASKDYMGEVNRIFDWVKKTVRYTRDPHGVELVQDVWATLSCGRGDCDDFTILLGAACEVMGAPCRIVTVSTRPDKEPVHVYPEVKVGNRWVPLDATVRGARPGWAPRRITDRIVWLRKDVGISGYDEDTIEGLGMDFKSSMTPVDFGVPNDISHTFADPMRGDPVLSRRRQPGAPYFKVATNSELVQSPAPGGLPYAVPMPVEPERLPSQNWSGISRPLVPMKLNPWPNEVKKWSKNWGAMLPQETVTEDREMSNLNGLGFIGTLAEDDLDEITGAIELDVTRKVKNGTIPVQQAGNAVAATVDAVKRGDKSALRSMPMTSSAVSKVARRSSNGSRAATPATSPSHAPTAGMIRHGNIRAMASEYGTDADESCDWLPNMNGLSGQAINQGRHKLYRQVHAQVKQRLPQAAHEAGVHPRRIKGLFNPAEARRLQMMPMNGLGELGDNPLPIDAGTTANAASAITGGIMNLVDPADAQAVQQAVNSGIQALVGAAPAPAQPSILSKLNIGGWGVPLMVLAGITGVAYFMSKPKARKFRRNPSRRSRRSGGRRGGSGFEKYIPWALGAGAAYLILKPKAATGAPGTAAPAQQGILSSLMNLFKPSSAPSSAQGAANMVQAASSPFTSLLNTIFGKPSTPTTAAKPAPTTQGPLNIVTERDIYGSTPSQPSGIVTSIDDVAPAPSGGSSEMIFDLES